MSLHFNKPWKCCSKSCWHCLLICSKETVFSAMQNSDETVCLGHIKLLNSRYLSKYIYLIDLLNIKPSPFSGNPQKTYYHLSHDISPPYFPSKVIYLNISWRAAIRCGWNMPSFLPSVLFTPPAHDIHCSSWHSFSLPTSQLKCFTFRKCSSNSGQQDKKPELVSVLGFTETMNNIAKFLGYLNLGSSIVHTTHFWPIQQPVPLRSKH